MFRNGKENKSISPEERMAEMFYNSKYKRERRNNYFVYTSVPWKELPAPQKEDFIRTVKDELANPTVSFQGRLLRSLVDGQFEPRISALNRLSL